MDKRKTTPGSTVPLLPVVCDVEASDLAMCSTKHARKRLSYSEARRWKVLPLSVVNINHQNILNVLCEDDVSYEILRALQFVTDCAIHSTKIGRTGVIEEAIVCAYRGDGEEIEEVLKELGSSISSKENDIPLTFDEHSIPGILVRIIEYAHSKGASDITLIQEGPEKCSCKLRIDGAHSDHSFRGYTPQIHQQLINRVKVLGGLSLDDGWTPVDGCFEVPLPAGVKQVRFHLFPTVHGTKVNFRLPAEAHTPELGKLGFQAKTQMYLQAVMGREQGGIVLSGPTGSGKTTTAYSVLQELARKNLSIVSLEDPVERELVGASQTDLSRVQGLSYADGIKHLLRQDPDVIFVGEVRDERSAKAALEAAVTGHLLVTSVHGGRVIDVLQRIGRFASESELTADALSLVIAQRLLPKLCSACKVVDLKGTRIAGGVVHQAVGCSRCGHSGYKGRVLIEEALFLTPELKRAIKAGDITEEKIIGKPSFQSLEDSLREVILRGDVDMLNAQKLVPVNL